jgi:hypothetical protein
MTLQQQTARFVAATLDKSDSDRYEQIWAIKSALLAHGHEILATDRETIDAVLDILFDEYGFRG